MAETPKEQNVVQDERAMRIYTEQVLDRRQEELQFAESANQELLRRLDHLSKEASDIKAQLLETRNEMKTNERNSEDSGDQVCRRKRNRGDITESEARDAYKALCDKVHCWVAQKLSATLDSFSSGRLKKPLAQQAAKFLSLVREPSKKCLSVHQGDEYHVSAVVVHYLWLMIFSKSFHCPLDDSGEDSTLAWIDGVATTMAKSRDLEQCRAWRSETLAALTSQDSFKSRRDIYLSMISRDLASHLTAVFPHISTKELQSSLHKSVIQPAADLAHRLDTSVDVFWLKWPLKTAGSRLELYECSNIADKGRLVDLTSTQPGSASRRHVKYLFDMAPGLFVERVVAGKKTAMKAVCRPRVLVHACEGEVTHKATLLTWLCSAWRC